MESLRNVSIGEYRILESLGAGGMGEVYKAVHTHLGRVIAIKVLSPGLADGPALERFYGEANIQAGLKHPGVAEYLGFYEYQGRPCILMEYVDGETLAAMIRRRGPLPPGEAADLVREIAAVVAHFHVHGVVHRDLKTNNVKVNSAGRVKILDFGIARGQRSDRLTRVGAVIGTPEALSPEQVRGEPATPATDVWQLGVLLYELLTCRLPFQGYATQEMYARILAADFPHMARWRPGIPAALEKIVFRCLQKDAARRYPSAAELHQALCQWEQPAVAHGERTLIWGALAVALLVVAGALVIPTWSDHTPAPAAAEKRFPPGPPDLKSVTDVPPAAEKSLQPSLPEMKTVTVDTADGAAQVFREGKLVGLTPYRVQARSGEKIELLLRRDGFHDLPLDFEAGERHDYTYTMEPRRQR